MYRTELENLARELEYARGKWGTSFDEKNTINDFVAYVTLYLGEAVKLGATEDEQYAGFLKAAGLALTGAYYIRNGVSPRHYEGEPSRGHLNVDSYKA